MTTGDQSRFSRARKLLGNPYAYIDEFAGDAQPAVGTYRMSPSAAQIRVDRIRLQDPYAHLEDFIELETLPAGEERANQIQSVGFSRKIVSNARASRRFTNRQIEEEANRLLRAMWQRREQLWSDQTGLKPIEILDPVVGLTHIGFSVVHETALGSFPDSGGRSEVAGLIDRSKRKVYLSDQFSQTVQLFTAAHELGHAVLHKNGQAVHRDRPVDGTYVGRSIEEREADKFATYFLMPEKLVRKCFTEVLGISSFQLDETTAFALFGLSLNDARNKIFNLDEIAKTLAGARRFNGIQVVPLNEQFRVSVQTMAIRLQELALVSL